MKRAQKEKNNIQILLHNIRSAHNVGSIFRTADAAGVTTVYLSGYTPTPVDRFGRAQKEIAKTALGAEISVTWEYVASPSSVIKRLKKKDFEIVAVEQNRIAKNYKDFKIEKPTLFLFGNEVRGLSTQLQKSAHQCIKIAMHGKKESLNVSVTAGIILFEYVR
jgi:23S rRNA (guanosine2251-2'-O)-methyltransferase